MKAKRFLALCMISAPFRSYIMLAMSISISLTSNYNFDKMKTISSNAKNSLDDYKKNPTILGPAKI